MRGRTDQNGPPELRESPDPQAGTIPVSDVLRESEERFRALTEHAREAIAEITADACFQYVSPGFTDLLGWRPEEVVGKSGLELVHPDDLPHVDEIRRQAFEQTADVQAVFRFRHRNGSWRWIDVAGSTYRNRSGELRAALVSRDVTDRVAAEEALRQQLDVERQIADLSRRFLHVAPGDFDTCAQHALAVAARLARAERTQLYLLSGAHGGIDGFYRWCAEGCSSPPTPRLDSARRDFRWSADQLLAGQLVHVRRSEDLPAAARAEREVLQRDGVRSYLAIPLRFDRRFVGFLDFFRSSDGGWTDAEVTRLGLVAEVLGSALRRLEAERERAEVEERFRALAQHAKDTICEMDLSGRVLWVSPSFAAMSGFSPDDVAAMNPWALLHPDDSEELRWLGGRSAATGEGFGPVRYRCRHRDGSWRWIESTATPFRAPGGEMRVAVVSRDVTDQQRRRAEIERQLETERRVTDFSRALLEEGADQIERGIERGLAVAAEIAGADRAYLVSALPGRGEGPAIFDWSAPGVPPRENKLGLPQGRHGWVLDRLLNGEVVRVPRPAELPDEAGPVRDDLTAGGVASLLCIPINSEGKLLGVLGFHALHDERDWSEREVTLLRLVADLFTSALRRRVAEQNLKESQERLLQAQKMEAVGTLAGGIAHDFNNQLTVMLANARFARRQVDGNEEVSRALDDLHRAAEHCAQLTRSLLAFSRRTSSSPRTLEARAVVAEVRELLRPLISTSIRMEIDDPPAELMLTGDVTQLQQVLVNLVVNARDAMPAGGRLWLRTAARSVSSAEARRLGLAAPGAYVEFSVEDTGVGMAEEVRARVFEPFFTTKAVGEGTGLGLATAYGIVQQSGGVITVDSEPGHGSVFRVLLPRALEADAWAEPMPISAPPPGSGTVLLAEDEANVRRLLARMLAEGGYEVIEAGDGADALRLGRQHIGQLTAVVTDIDMPLLGGVELVRRLVRQRPGLPVLFISGSATGVPGAGDPDLPAERWSFLAKPFDEGPLLDSLHALTSGR